MFCSSILSIAINTQNATQGLDWWRGLKNFFLGLKLWLEGIFLDQSFMPGFFQIAKKGRDFLGILIWMKSEW